MRRCRWAFRSKRAAYDAYALPTIEAEAFIPTLVGYGQIRVDGMQGCIRFIEPLPVADVRDDLH